MASAIMERMKAEQEAQERLGHLQGFAYPSSSRTVKSSPDESFRVPCRTSDEIEQENRLAEQALPAAGGQSGAAGETRVKK